MKSNQYAYTTQAQVRQAFWLEYPQASKRKQRDGDYVTDTRVMFCDFVESLSRSGMISDALASRVTLK
jgi:hypothetical protein